MESLQKFARNLSKIAADLSAAERDAGRLDAVVSSDESDEADYRDEAKMAELATARVKLEFCRKSADRLTEKAEEYLAQWDGIAYSAGQVAAQVLSELAERRLETITCALLPFSADRSNAQQLALQTDAYQRAAGSVAQYSAMSHAIRRGNGPKAIVQAANQISAVLAEALKDAPDLMKFFPPVETSVQESGAAK